MKKKRHSQPQGESARHHAWFDARVVGLVLAVKALLFLYGAQSYAVWKNEWVGSPPRMPEWGESLYNWLAIWNRWDAPHYLDIARMGYVSEGVEARWIVFFPLYPWLVRAAFFVSGVASVAAGLLLYRLARADGEAEEVARGAVFYLLVFPTAYFLHIGYNESLFLALALGAFLAARGRKWWAAGLLGFFAALTRINGVVLLSAVAFAGGGGDRGVGGGVGGCGVLAFPAARAPSSRLVLPPPRVLGEGEKKRGEGRRGRGPRHQHAAVD